MNPNEMTAQECADWLAKDYGWEVGYDLSGVRVWSRFKDNRHLDSYCHPYPQTLDAAAKALADGWEWDDIIWWEDSIQAQIRHLETRKTLQGNHTISELTARYRLAVASRIAAKEAK